MSARPWYAPENLAPARLKRLDDLVSRVDPAKPVEFRVFRRETPLISPALRPVDVTGTPLPVGTLGSVLLLTYTDAEQSVFFYEDNILVDSLNPEATWPVAPGAAISLAIRNALFTITPVNSLFLFARLRNEEMVQQGTLLLGMGLYGARYGTNRGGGHDD